MPFNLGTSITRQLVAQISLFGMGLDVLGGIYLAYDLLGGKNGPLRIITRAVGYIVLFFIGYLVVLGTRYAAVAAPGMGVLLALEYRIASDRDSDTVSRTGVMLFGFLRGAVLGLAAMTIAGPRFGLWFGVLSGAALVATYRIGFAPTDDYAKSERPRASKHKLLASLVRAIAVGAAGALAGIVFHSSAAISNVLGLRLGASAGCVSALVGVFSPVIEWRIENLPERRMGVVGLILIVAGMALQSLQLADSLRHLAAIVRSIGRQTVLFFCIPGSDYHVGFTPSPKSEVSQQVIECVADVRRAFAVNGIRSAC